MLLGKWPLRGSSSSAHAQNHRVSRTRRWEPPLPAAECFLPVHFQSRTREAGSAEEDGVAAGSEARAATGQRPRRPPRLSTNFLQVGGQSHALGLWAGLVLAGFLERGAGLGHLGEIAALVKDSLAQSLPFFPRPKSQSRVLPETRPKPALEIEL